jgi:hypothetical protein
MLAAALEVEVDAYVLSLADELDDRGHRLVVRNGQVVRRSLPLPRGAWRALNNVFIERLCRTLKYDHICLSPADSGTACREGIRVFLNYYNCGERSHSSLDDKTSDEVHRQTRINRRAA